MEKKQKKVVLLVPDLAFAEREGGYTKGHETRELILRAALGILINEGYQAMSMRRVATACGFKMGNLTYHFTSREDLVRELLNAVIKSYENAFEEIMHMPGLPPAERLSEICRLILEDIRSKKTTRLFPELWSLSNHDQFVLERVQELYERARKSITDIIAEMRPDLGESRRASLALFISAAMEGLTVFAGYEKPFENKMPELEEISIQAFLGIIDSLKA
jgi:AcrR family transcriptional regulator